jgi:hypothetical protein
MIRCLDEISSINGTRTDGTLTVAVTPEAE